MYPKYISEVRGEISHIRHPSSPYSYAITKEAGGEVFHFMLPREEGAGISIDDKIVANFDNPNFDGPHPNCVSVLREDISHVYVLEPAYKVSKSL